MRSCVVLVAAVASLLPSLAHAHFHLDAPATAYPQNSTGDPQIAAPCGDNNGTLTADVTTVMAGSTFTLTINETIDHPGHYRVALAQDEASLPGDPPVTAGTSACGSVPIDASPTLPLLADGVFKHTAGFSTPQTTQITVPAGTTCTNCIVQVLEFMSSHAQPCFYYHCARVNVIAGALPDAGVGATPDAGTTGGNSDSGGCNSGGGGQGAPATLTLMLLGLLVRRRAARR